jgi:zinc protease
VTRRVAAVLAAGLAVAPPGGRVLAAQEPFPSEPPAPMRLAPARFPPFQEATLPNGLEVVVVERHDQPVASVSLTFRAGDADDPPGKEGLARLTARLLTKGTATRTADEIAAVIEGSGGTLSASADADFLTLTGEALSDQLPLLFTVLGDVTRHATFPPSELDLARTQELSALALARSQPERVATRFFRREIYGPNPYGRAATAESYQAITEDDVVRFARTRLVPSGALLVVAGDVTLGQVGALARQAFAEWHGAPPASSAPEATAPRRDTDILLIDRPGSVQSVILVGNTTAPPTDPQYYAARVVTHVLGGGPDSRLFRVLREQHSWSYETGAGLHRYRGLGYWSASVGVRTAATDSALHELLDQVQRIRTELVPDSELAAAKGYLVGSFPLSIETPGEVAHQVSTAKLLGLGPDYLRLYRERLSAVTAREARAAAARLYHAGSWAIVVAGDAAKLYDRLRAIAPVRLIDPDGRPLAADSLEAAAPPPPDRAE